jgi:hypothetical protein
MFLLNTRIAPRHPAERCRNNSPDFVSVRRSRPEMRNMTIHRLFLAKSSADR